MTIDNVTTTMLGNTCKYKQTLREGLLYVNTTYTCN